MSEEKALARQGSSELGVRMKFIQDNQNFLEKFCADDARADLLQRHAELELRSNDDLLRCTPGSIYMALLACAVTGLVPGKLKGYAYLIPFSGEATFMLGYKGIEYMAKRAGIQIQSAVIHENDTFVRRMGTSPLLEYVPEIRTPGVSLGAAAWAFTKFGYECEFVDNRELAEIKKFAERKRPSPAWSGAFRGEMERKSAVRRLGKHLELSDGFDRANMIEDEGDETGSQVGAVDLLTDGAATKVLARQSAEAAAFGAAPRPAQVQVSAVVGTTASGDPVRAVGVAPARPTKPRQSDAGSSGSAGAGKTGSNGSAKPSAGGTAASPDPTPATAPSTSSAGPAPGGTQPGASASADPRSGSTAGSPQPAASASSPEASSRSLSGSESSASSSSEESSTAEPGSDSDEDMFINEPEEAAAPKRTMGDFTAWVKSCKTKKEMVDGRGPWLKWAAEEMGWAMADKAAGTPASKEATEMQKIFADHYRTVS